MRSVFWCFNWIQYRILFFIFDQLMVSIGFCTSVFSNLLFTCFLNGIIGNRCCTNVSGCYFFALIFKKILHFPSKDLRLFFIRQFGVAGTTHMSRIIASHWFDRQPLTLLFLIQCKTEFFFTGSFF